MTRIVSFHATVLEAEPPHVARVEIRIGCVSLLDLVRAAEHPFAANEGVPALAGNYAWPVLAPRLLRVLAGDPNAKSGAQGVLLNCPCDWASCWPLRLRVKVFDRLVTWQELAQVKRGSRWTYASLEPLRFSRVQYFDEIGRLRDALAHATESSERKRLAASPVRALDECAV